MGSETVVIPSEEGVHQGDPLGPALFSLAIHPVLSQLQKDHHNVCILAYLDDIFVLGESDNAVDAGLALKASLSGIGLSICDGKCELFTPNPLDTNSCSFPVSNNGTTVSGIPLGSPSYVISKCEETATSADRLCSVRSSLEDPQSGNLLLHHCHVPRLKYLARAVTPELFQSAAEMHDDMTRNTFSNMLGVSSLSDDCWNQATLQDGRLRVDIKCTNCSSCFPCWLGTLNFRLKISMHLVKAGW